MPDSQKVTVLLADEDSLRRDGLAAVLGGTPGIDVIGGCPDGPTALDEIRNLRPDVAVVDLSLPGLHGIELVRRVRSENLGTKIIILSGSMDDEIVREVVRAGADGYLLKSGPARHLMDAISYVRDGGQYFSPRLQRDGRDRHLLEEPPREAADRAIHDSDVERLAGERRFRRRGADTDRFRERIRAEASRDLRDRDYEIMAEMADGIRPILDRLDEIEERVEGMEEGGEPVPPDPRGWLNTQLAETLGGSRSSIAERGASRASARDVEARLPELIEEAVTKRFQQMAGKLQAEIEDTHVRTLENFVKNIQVKLVQRVSALEQNMSQQTEAMQQLREYNQRTEDNLTRLLSGVDKLAQELPKRLAAAQQAGAAQSVEPGEGNDSGSANARIATGKKRVRSGGSKNIVPKVFWSAVGLAILVSVGFWAWPKIAGSGGAKAPAEGSEVQNAASAAGVPKTTAPAAGADTKTKLEAAKQYMELKEYVNAEAIYRQVVAAEPNNVEAIKGLASVLYREDKIEESTSVLERLPRN